MYRRGLGAPLFMFGHLCSLDPVGLFKKAMLSTGQAFCKKPWYLSNSPKRRNKRKRMAGIEPKNPCMMAIILAMPLTTTLSKL
jgi:hypothetical protein